MSAFIRARAVATWRHGSLWRFHVAVSLMLLALAGCTAPRASTTGISDPSDAEAATPGTAYRGVLRNYQSRRPATPADWRSTNDAVVPNKDSK